MKQNARRRLNVLIAISAGFLVAPLQAQVPPPETQRISFQIATGPVSGSYMRVGEAVARIISNPPGLARCETDGVCGPEGLIATSRSSSGSISNVFAVNAGRVKSALVQGDILADAYDGEGPFKATGALSDLRAIARLHDETLHLVVSPKSRIRKLRDLAGKRVSIDTETSATNQTVRSLLAAAGINANRLRLSFLSGEQASEAMRNGKLDAFFVIGVAPIRSVDSVVRRELGRVIAIDTKAVGVLARRNPLLSKTVLAADTYRSSKSVATLNVASVWVVNKSMPNDVVYAILRSLWNPANRIELKRLGKAAGSIDAARAGENLPVPLHEGAQRFYAEAGR